MRNAKYAMVAPGSTDHRMGVWVEKVGWLPDGRAVWEWADHRLWLAPEHRYPSVQITLTPHGAFYATGPHAGFAWSPSMQMMGAAPPPEDGWDAESTIAPGTPPPPIRPMLPQMTTGLAEPEEPPPWREWTMTWRAYSELVRFADETRKRLTALEAWRATQQGRGGD